ncbi:MAG: glycolate oxidase subunit GlcE [Mariprofundaceae bacterium]|nr:glycolate oxidase subunit GlcE [Mariprofundaceae bacterium]
MRIQNAVKQAFADATPLNIIAGNSKSWYGREATGAALHIGEHAGIINYLPTELIITAKAGTPLADIAAALDTHKQRLPFDPPYFSENSGKNATLGGTVACGFSGPRRPYAGSCRDFVLACRIVNGQGEILKFGAEVMKNVAGFDVSRLQTGSLGTLGVLLDISLKVLPHRLAEQTIVIEADFVTAINVMNRWAGTPLPVTAMCADGRRIYFRICGTPSSVQTSMQRIGGSLLADGLNFWKSVREHTLPFFDHQRPLYRLSLPAAHAHLSLADAADDDWFIGWGGAQRWLKSELPAEVVFAAAQAAGGHATLFRNGDRQGDVFAPLSHALWQWHKRIKQAFDPKCILNPGRMYRDL